MNETEFVEFANRRISPESRIRHITVDDIRHWTKKGLFKSAPNYYHYDIQIVLALLQLEREGQSRSSTRPQHTQPAQTDVSRARDLEAMFQKGITQVVTCVASSFTDEQRIIQALKDAGLICSQRQKRTCQSPTYQLVAKISATYLVHSPSVKVSLPHSKHS